MKQFNAVKQIFIIALLCAASTVNGQIHPAAFTSGADSNWYADYVGLRFEVTYPPVIAGDKQYNAAWSGTTPWGAPVTTPIVNDTIVMGTAGAGMANDSFGGGTFTPGSMNGKIAVIWRGPEGSSAFNFSDKAIHAQNAGAIACVIINEYAGEGPVGMSAATTGASIPTFMIGNLDGIAISAQYRSGVPVTITITPWGYGFRNDVGFVPGGVAAWHAYAVPYDQLTPGTSPAPYKGLDGAFIANYGSSDAKNVKVIATLNYTPNGSGMMMLHRDTMQGESIFTGTAHLPTPDSIVAMFSNTEYDVAPASAGKGEYDLTYRITTDTPTQNPLDSSLTVSFYASDSVYSKGRYDFTKGGPISTIWEDVGGGSDFVWGNMYYVQNAGDAVSTLQFSLYNSGSTLGAITAGNVNLFVFKWVDGSAGDSLDGIVENGELSLVSIGNYVFQPTDTSGEVFTVPHAFMLDPLTGNSGDHAAWLDANSWYYVAAGVPGGYFLGVDGGPVDVFPRLYGRYHETPTNFIENMDLVWTGDYNTTLGAGGGGPFMVDSPALGYLPVAFSQSNYVDSMNYAGQKGLIPSISMIVTKTPDTSHLHDAVAGLVKPWANVTLFPNPAEDNINVSISLDHFASTVTYTIIDGLGRFVSKEDHYNVLNETDQISTRNLASGVYYLIVNANGRVLSRKFTVVR